MENILPYSSNAYIFDLKGSSISRYVEITDSLDIVPGRVLKDENFQLFDTKIYMTKEKVDEIIETLEEDMKVLMCHNIMDYSLLIGYYEKGHEISRINSRHLVKSYQNDIFAVGIIDIFQNYNKAKISERTLKTLLYRDREKLSVQPPGNYYMRICKLAREIFVRSPY
jgi:hypothetical protein